jgi:replicative DNA helicase
VSTALVDVETERLVLGAVMVNNALLAEVAQFVQAHHFSDGRHRLVYAAMMGLSETSTQIDPLTLRGRLGEDCEMIGGLAYLGGLDEGVPRMTTVGQWARTVREHARRRAFKAVCARAAEQASDEGIETDALIDMHQAQVLKLAESGMGGVSHIAKVIPEALKNLEAYAASASGVIGIATGLPDLDRMTSGLKGGELWIVAARPSRGKSVLCGQIAVHAASRGNKVLFFPQEMPAPDVAQRMTLSEADVDKYKLRRGGSDWDDLWARVGKAAGRLSQSAIWFDGNESATLTQVRAAARRHRDLYGLDLVIVDYLQRLSFDPRVERWIAVGDAAKGLKSLALALGVPVLVACQVNAEGEEKRPTMANLGQSAGIISAEADVIAFLHPEDMLKWREQPYPIVNLHLDKNRSGPTGAVGLSFDRPTLKFLNLARERA